LRRIGNLPGIIPRDTGPRAPGSMSEAHIMHVPAFEGGRAGSTSTCPSSSRPASRRNPRPWASGLFLRLRRARSPFRQLPPQSLLLVSLYVRLARRRCSRRTQSRQSPRIPTTRQQASAFRRRHWPGHVDVSDTYCLSLRIADHASHQRAARRTLSFIPLLQAATATQSSIVCKSLSHLARIFTRAQGMSDTIPRSTRSLSGIRARTHQKCTLHPCLL
jgi:hypothetical protein